MAQYSPNLINEPHALPTAVNMIPSYKSKQDLLTSNRVVKQSTEKNEIISKDQ